MTPKLPQIILGGAHKDDRGKLDFYNTFDMTPIKRVYFTKHFDTNTVRAWQGHIIEIRWFICVSGSFKIKLVKVDDWQNPSENLIAEEFILNESQQKILYIPNGFANGFKAIKENSKLMILSDYGYNEIENDQVRFNQNNWTTW